MTPTQARVMAICAEMLGAQRLELDDDLYEMGSDSHQAVLVALEIEKAFGIEMPLEVMEERANVRALAAWVDDRLAPAARRAVPSHSSDSGLPGGD